MQTPGGRRTAIAGTPVLESSRRRLKKADLDAIPLHDRSAWRRLAAGMQGQFSVIVREGGDAVAITDLTGTHPVFIRKQTDGSGYEVSGSFSELARSSSRVVRRTALYEYIALGTMDQDGQTFLADIDRAKSGAVTFCAESGVESCEYCEWPAPEPGQGRSVEEAGEELESILVAYARREFADSDDPIGVLLSGGTDSTLLAAILRKEFPGRLRCITQDYRLSRYSEIRQARENAATLGLETAAVCMTRADHLREIVALNTPEQDQPIYGTQTFNLSALARRTSLPSYVVGEHADSLFLGFGHFFAALPSETTAYREAAAALRFKDRLDRVLPTLRCNAADEEILSELGLPRQEFLDWLGGYRERRSQALCQAEGRSLIWLQQLAHQIDGGGSWQRIVLPVKKAQPAKRFVCPFFETKVIRFGMRQPPEFIYHDGHTKYVLRRMLHRYLGRELTKKSAAASPVAVWRILPRLSERRLISPLLRKYYERLTVRNLVQAGRPVSRLLHTAALGIWLQQQGF